MDLNICPLTILYIVLLNIICGKGAISNINYYCHYLIGLQGLHHIHVHVNIFRASHTYKHNIMLERSSVISTASIG